MKPIKAPRHRRGASGGTVNRALSPVQGSGEERFPTPRFSAMIESLMKSKADLFRMARVPMTVQAIRERTPPLPDLEPKATRGSITPRRMDRSAHHPKCRTSRRDRYQGGGAGRERLRGRLQLGGPASLRTFLDATSRFLVDADRGGVKNVHTGTWRPMGGHQGSGTAEALSLRSRASAVPEPHRAAGIGATAATPRKPRGLGRGA